MGTLNGYFLRGIEDDYILVLRSDDSEELLRVISRLRASRDKQIKTLATELELRWYKGEAMKKKGGRKIES